MTASSVSCSAAVPTWRAERLLARQSASCAVGDDASPALVKAEQRQRRNQHGGCEQERRRPVEEGLHPQPEIKPDAAVDPGDDKHARHQPDLVRPRHPE